MLKKSSLECYGGEDKQYTIEIETKERKKKPKRIGRCIGLEYLETMCWNAKFTSSRTRATSSTWLFSTPMRSWLFSSRESTAA